MKKQRPTGYHQYHIETKKTPNIVSHPHRFRVKVHKLGLAKLLLKELIHYRGHLNVVKSRPCVYGVFSGPVGGFSPREELCVGCLRCTTQYPDLVAIRHNPEREKLGDAYFHPLCIDTIVQEAETGRVPVRGQGYRGPFGGSGWDGMWTDMSEIVRPTRDGIHGREHISTEVNIGHRLPFLNFDTNGQPLDEPPQMLTLPLPLLLDTPPVSNRSDPLLCKILVESARQLQTYVVLPLSVIQQFTLHSEHTIPLVDPDAYDPAMNLGFAPRMVELSAWNEGVFRDLRTRFPHTLVALRCAFESFDPSACYHAGVRIFHLTANYHGRGRSNRFVLELIREAHLAFVQMGVRNEVTLLGSGGIASAEHIPKGIICGLDAVTLDIPVLVALQATFTGDCSQSGTSRFTLPSQLSMEWGVSRLKNLVGAWRDQLIEVLGAMGLREVRRLRGEIGRAMFQKDLEVEAFKGINGYETQ